MGSNARWVSKSAESGSWRVPRNRDAVDDAPGRDRIPQHGAQATADRVDALPGHVDHRLIPVEVAAARIDHRPLVLLEGQDLHQVPAGPSKAIHRIRAGIVHGKATADVTAPTLGRGAVRSGAPLVRREVEEHRVLGIDDAITAGGRPLVGEVVAGQDHGPVPLRVVHPADGVRPAGLDRPVAPRADEGPGGGGARREVDRPDHLAPVGRDVGVEVVAARQHHALAA